MSMSEPRRLACLKITEKLMKRPCAKLFLHPVDPEAAPGYKDIIKSPQDLTSIRKRLIDKEYPTIESWEHDMILIWYNAERYNGHDSLPYILANALNEQYKKLRERYLIYNYILWSERCELLQKKFDRVLAINPGITRNHFPAINLPKERNQKLRENEYIVLYKSLQKLRSPADTHAFVNIFFQYEPQIPAHEDPLSVDLRSLHYDTLLELRKYCRKRLSELGLKYE